MLKHRRITRGGIGLIVAGGLVVWPLTGCESLPGSPGEQGAVIGGVGGAATGAVVAGSGHRLLGALIGGALGAGGGYLIGANKDKILGNDQQDAQDAVQQAKNQPATAAQARQAATADINGDGFVTTDEVIALAHANYTDQQILDKLAATGQVFELTPQEQTYLENHGVSANVVQKMQNLNHQTKQQLLNRQQTQNNPQQQGQVISHQPNQ